MIFHSLDFIAFFVLTTALYWSVPHRLQNVLMLAASYVFYGWIHPWFVTLIAATTVVDFWAARAMERWPDHKGRFLGTSIAVNLGLLGFFKYVGFFVDNVHAVLGALGLDLPKPALAVVLPVGISFYTFQELSYTIDVYRGTLRARRSLVDFAAFVSLYPQLVAGPIERAAHLLPQVERRRTFSWLLARQALFLIAWGYFKKLVVADNAGVIANKVFSLAEPGFFVLWAGVFAFAMQIYADFSAYSDIARGVARWIGFDLKVNFDHPYMSRSPAEFWRRWHISLSTWFRDYVYIPLGGSRRGTAIALRNVWLTFVLSGLWHGASWNFVLWGAYHGTLVVLARLLGASGDTTAVRPLTWSDGPKIAGTFLLVCVGWLMFRETDLPMLLRDLSLSPFDSTAADREMGAYLFLLTLTYAWPLWLHDVWIAWIRPRLASRPAEAEGPIWRVAGQTVLAGLGLAGILVFRSQQSLDFIYFQF